MTRIAEKNESLWILTFSPLIWAAHLLLSYITAAIWCEKVADSLVTVRIAIAVFTALALIGIGITGWVGYRRHRFGHGELPHDDDTPQDRHRFLGFATVLLSALSGVAVIYAGLVAIFIARCY